MSFHPTPSELMRFKLRTAVAQAKFSRESIEARAARVESRRFSAEPVPLTNFGTLDPFRLDERQAEAME